MRAHKQELREQACLLQCTRLAGGVEKKRFCSVVLRRNSTHTHTAEGSCPGPEKGLKRQDYGWAGNSHLTPHRLQYQSLFTKLEVSLVVGSEKAHTRVGRKLGEERKRNKSMS